jgi:hypothetical protein
VPLVRGKRQGAVLMAKGERGARRGAMSGRRAAPGKGGEAKPGRPASGKYRLRGKAAQAAEDVPCPAGGRHGPDCICGGSGTVKGTK